MPLVCAFLAITFAQAYAKPSVRKVNGYTITSIPRPADRYDREASVIVKDENGKTILTVKDWAASLEWIEDIGGTGAKVAAISAYTGGAHCCETDYFISLGPKPKLLARYEMGNVSGLQVKHRPGTKRKDIFTGYDGFAYYHNSYAGSAHLPMVLRLSEGRIVEATKEYPDLLKSSYKDACKELEENNSVYEEMLVKKESSGGGLFDNSLCGPIIEVYALGVLLGTDKEAADYLSKTCYRDDLVTLDELKPEINKILGLRAGRLTYPALPFTHDGGLEN